MPVEMGVEPAAEEAVLQTISPERVAAIKDTCALLLSCLHAWGVDETIGTSNEVIDQSISLNTLFFLLYSKIYLIIPTAFSLNNIKLFPLISP